MKLNSVTNFAEQSLRSTTSRSRIVNVNIVVFCRDRFFHEGFVKDDSIHFNMIFGFN